MTILGIESSCDETAAAVVQNGTTLLSNVVASQVDIHKQYGGVVPEVAARSHIEVINPLIEQALSEAFPDQDDPWESIDAIAVTHGPGLSGSLLVGTMAARALALIKNKPLYPVNHVIGHVYANFITPANQSTWKAPQFPILALIVSGLHSQLALFTDHINYTLLGQTHDDAVGEAFDKVSRIIGLGYPGGPAIEKAAAHGNPDAFSFPKARSKPPKQRQAAREQALKASKDDPKRMKGSVGGLGVYDFSFSGLKTAVLRQVQALVDVDHNFPSFELAERLSESQRQDIAASFNKVAAETLVEKTLAAYKEFSPENVVIAGGVAANQELRKQLQAAIPINIEYAAMNLCTDNAAMIATLGYYAAQQRTPTNPHEVTIQPSLAM